MTSEALMWIGLIAAALVGSPLTQADRLGIQTAKMGVLGGGLIVLGVADVSWPVAWIITVLLGLASVATCVRTRSEV